MPSAIWYYLLTTPFRSLLTVNNNNNKPRIQIGNATISGSVIQLMPDEVDNWGRATYLEQMHHWDEKSEKVANFTSNFSFIINSQGKDRYSDGLMFFPSTPNSPFFWLQINLLQWSLIHFKMKNLIHRIQFVNTLVSISTTWSLRSLPHGIVLLRRIEHIVQVSITILVRKI